MRKIAVAMAKGGVGKTTPAVNLAHGLSLAGHRVLIVDCDTQGQTAKFLGVTPPYGLYEFITGTDARGNPVAKKETLFPARENLWLLAGGINLVELKNWLGEQPREEEERPQGPRARGARGALDPGARGEGELREGRVTVADVRVEGEGVCIRPRPGAARRRR